MFTSPQKRQQQAQVVSKGQDGEHNSTAAQMAAQVYVRLK